MTSTRLTQQNRSREWAAALRARALLPTVRPHRPLLTRACQARLRRRIQTDTRSPGWPRMRPTHAHRRAGGCRIQWVRRRPAPLSYPERDNWSAIDFPRRSDRSGVWTFRALPKPCLRFPANLPRRRSARFRALPPPPLLSLDLIPSSTRAVLAAPLSVTHHPRHA